MKAPAKYDFLIAVPYGDKVAHRVAELIRKNKPFAVLMALSLLPEIDRKADGFVDLEVQAKRQQMPTISMSGVGKVWQINHPDLVSEEPDHKLFLTEQERPSSSCRTDCDSKSCNEHFLLHYTGKLSKR